MACIQILPVILFGSNGWSNTILSIFYRLAKISFATLLTAILVFPGLEFSLRVLKHPRLQYYRDLKLFHRYHDDYLVALEKNQNLYLKNTDGLWEGKFTTNSMGYRGSPEINPDRKHLVCLGDSIVMGFGVSDEETFCYLLNGIRLQNEIYQSINLGVDAFGSLGSLRRLEEADRQFSVDVALFVISPNDFTLPESLRERGILSDDENDVIRHNDPAYKRAFELQFELTRASYALMAGKLALEQLRVRYAEQKQFIRNRLIEAGLLSAGDEIEKRIQPVGPIRYFFRSYTNPPASPCPAGNEDLTVREVTCPAPVPRDIRCEDMDPPADRLEELPASTRAAYDEMIDFTRKNGIKLIPVMAPIQRESLYCYSNGRSHPLFRYALRAGDYFRKRGVEVLDLRPHLSKMCGEELEIDGKHKKSDPDDYYIPGDGHYTRAGNLWIAKALTEELKDIIQ